MQRLVECRKKAALTQQTMAEMLGVARNTYSRYETGEREPDFETLKKLAEYFKTTVSYLIGETNNPAPPNAEKEPPAFEEAMKEQGITNPEHIETLKRLVDLIKKSENNMEIADEFLSYDYNKRQNG